MGNLRVFSVGALTRRSLLAVLFLCSLSGWAQSPDGQGSQQSAEKKFNAETPMEFQSHGLDYEALTRNGITVMFASLPPHIKDFNIVQITVTNGSLVSWTVKPSDFAFVRESGVTLQPVSADDVVESLLQKASRTDVIKLQLLYEDSIYGLSNFRSTNGYEQRREAAMAQFVNRSFKAAVAASAITMVPARLKPGESTDGAVFFENKHKEKILGPGRLIAKTCGETFVFEVYPEIKIR
ncbi:MAG: hypothetical protein ACJ74Y_13270 [Bryobacteraceae bacterium]